MATTSPTTTRAPIERAEHPHVVTSADTLGGEPRVEDTRIPVRQFANLGEAGPTVAEIVETWPRLTRLRFTTRSAAGTPRTGCPRRVRPL